MILRLFPSCSRVAGSSLHQPSELLPSPATEPLSSPADAPDLFLANGSVAVNSTAVTMVITNTTHDGPNGTFVERGGCPRPRSAVGRHRTIPSPAFFPGPA